MTCQLCGEVHVVRLRGLPQPHLNPCNGHVKFERVEGKSTAPRVPLEKWRPCSKSANLGASTCHKHGATAKHVAAKAKKRIERAKLEALMVTLGEPVEGMDTVERVEERIAARHGHVRWLLARVRDMEPEALVWGTTKTVRGDVVVGTGPGASLDKATTDTEEAKPSVWYALYREASLDFEKLCVAAIAAGLEQRRVELAERDSDIWVRMIDGVLREMGHDPNDPQTAGIVARHLYAVGE